MKNSKRIQDLTATTLMAAMLAVGVGHALAHPLVPQDGPATVNEAESTQPVADAWITTKVKSQLLADDQTEGSEIDVDTVEGVVHLSGAIGSQAEIDKAIAIARATEGVKDVDASGLTVSSVK